MLFRMDRMRDFRSVTLKTLEGSRLVSETLGMFIAGVLAIAFDFDHEGWDRRERSYWLLF